MSAGPTSATRKAVALLTTVVVLVLVMSTFMLPPSAPMDVLPFDMNATLSLLQGGTEPDAKQLDGGRGDEPAGAARATTQPAPTDLPPTDLPPTDLPPTDIPPTDLPRTVPTVEPSPFTWPDFGDRLRATYEHGTFTYASEDEYKLLMEQAPNGLTSRLLRNLIDVKYPRSFEDYIAFHKRGRERLAAGEMVPVLMYSCDASGGVCGGLGNRLHGLVDGLVLAMLLDRVFLARSTRTIDWRVFVQPGLIDWSEPTMDGPAKRILDGATRKALFIDIMDDWGAKGPAGQSLMHDDVMAKLQNHAVVKFKSTVLWMGELLDNPHLRERADRYSLRELNFNGTLARNMLAMILRPTPVLLQPFIDQDKALRNETGLSDMTSVRFIGLQIRGSRIDFDSNYRNFTNETALVAQQMPNDTTPYVFLTTEKAGGVDKLRNALYDGDTAIHSFNSEWLGKATHIEEVCTGKLSIACEIRAWFDYFVLVAADHLVISRSSFSEMASAISCAPTSYFRGILLEKPDFTPDRSGRGYCDLWASLKGVMYGYHR